MISYNQTFITVITWVGIVDTTILMILLSRSFFLWIKGVSPSLIRLGNGLAKRKIAIFAKGDNVTSLRSLLIDSGLFKSKNIFEVAKMDDIGKADQGSVYLVYWHDWAADIDEILRNKPDKCALIVYAPYDLGRIPDEEMKKLDGKRHSAVTNFRGRLLNDIVTSMITTTYDSK